MTNSVFAPKGSSIGMSASIGVTFAVNSLAALRASAYWPARSSSTPTWTCAPDDFGNEAIALRAVASA